MCETLNMYNLAVLRKNLFLKIKTDIRLTLKKYPLVKMQTDIQLQNLRPLTGFRKFFINPPETDRIHPP